MLEVPSSVRSRLGVCLGLLRVKSRPMPFEPPKPWECRARQGFHYGMDRVLLRHVSIRIHGRWKQRLNLEDFVAEGNTVDHKERHPSSGHSLCGGTKRAFGSQLNQKPETTGPLHWNALNSF